MKSKNLILHAVMVITCMLSVGCSPAYREFAGFLGAAVPHSLTHQEHMTFLNANDHVASSAGYILSPPDVIQVYSPQAQEVNGQFAIRPDGTIRLPLLNTIRLAGLTPRESAAKLQRELEVYYEDPYVEVAMASSRSRAFYLFGEISGGGGAGRNVRGGGGGSGRTGYVVPITGRDDILSVLTEYPPTQNAWVTQIKLMRPNPKDPKKNQEIIIDFYKMIASGDLRQNILLQEGDILYVPPTPMAWVGYRIREILQPVSPVIAAWNTPAQILAADEVYKGDDSNNNNERASVLGTIRLP